MSAEIVGVFLTVSVALSKINESEAGSLEAVFPLLLH
jgi:hypothetical protein